MVRSTLSDAQARRPGGQAAHAALDLAARLPRLALEARRVSAFVNGVHGRRRPGPGESFWQYRTLMPGESSAGVDWRRSGRDDRLYIREREWEASHTVWLWIDRSASMGFRSELAAVSKLDRALVLGLALADGLVQGGERVGMMGLTGPLASRRIVERLVEALGADTPGLTRDLPDMAPIGRMDEAILISDWLTPADAVARVITALGARGGRGHVVTIADPAEEIFPFAGQAELRDVEDGLRLDVGDAADWGRLYRARLGAHRETIADACQRIGWTMTLHRTDRAATEAAIRLANLVRTAPGLGGR